MARTGPATGGCLCGAVRLSITELPGSFGACHCEMCRRWTGSAFLAVETPAERVHVEGADAVARMQSSDWAERAWCARCGSPLWYRVTEPGVAGFGAYEIPLGLLDDASGLRFATEIFADCKPDSYTYEGMAARETLTRAETFAKFAPSAQGESR
jgi:hypothetical protein